MYPTDMMLWTAQPLRTVLVDSLATSKIVVVVVREELGADVVLEAQRAVPASPVPPQAVAEPRHLDVAHLLDDDTDDADDEPWHRDEEVDEAAPTGFAWLGEADAALAAAPPRPPHGGERSDAEGQNGNCRPEEASASGASWAKVSRALVELETALAL